MICLSQLTFAILEYVCTPNYIIIVMKIEVICYTCLSHVMKCYRYLAKCTGFLLKLAGVIICTFCCNVLQSRVAKFNIYSIT